MAALAPYEYGRRGSASPRRSPSGVASINGSRRSPGRSPSPTPASYGRRGSAASPQGSSLLLRRTASGATDPAADFARPFSAVLADIDLHRARSPRLSPTPPRRGSPLSRVAYRSPYRRSPTLSPPARTVFLPRGDHRALSPPAGIVPL